MAWDLTLDDPGKNAVLHTNIVTPPKAVTIVLMAKNKKKKRRLVVPNKKLLILSGMVLAVAIVYMAVWLAHNHAVTRDRSRFARAGNDVETVASAVIAAVGPPADRKDGGKCSYAHQEFSKGPLSCEVYSYLAYGVNSPDDVNAIVQKVDALPVLHGNPWQFKAVTEKPHQFDGGVQYSDNFEALRNLLDAETQSVLYADEEIHLSCAISSLYHDSVSNLDSYPNFNIGMAQTLLLDIDCTGGAKSPYFGIEN